MDLHDVLRERSAAVDSVFENPPTVPFVTSYTHTSRSGRISNSATFHANNRCSTVAFSVGHVCTADVVITKDYLRQTDTETCGKCLPSIARAATHAFAVDIFANQPLKNLLEWTPDSEDTYFSAVSGVYTNATGSLLANWNSKHTSPHLNKKKQTAWSKAEMNETLRLWRELMKEDLPEGTIIQDSPFVYMLLPDPSRYMAMDYIPWWKKKHIKLIAGGSMGGALMYGRHDVLTYARPIMNDLLPDFTHPNRAAVIEAAFTFLREGMSAPNAFKTALALES